MELELYKEADANVVDVARRVKERLFGDGMPKEWGGSPGLSGDLPEGVSLRGLDDQAAFIESAIDNLRDTAVLGGVFAVGVLFLFYTAPEVLAQDGDGDSSEAGEKKTMLDNVMDAGGWMVPLIVASIAMVALNAAPE